MNKGTAEYACFYDDPSNSNFFTIMNSAHLREVMVALGTFNELPKNYQAELRKNFVESRGYKNGVAFSEDESWDLDGDSWRGPNFSLGASTGHIRFTISWETLRFRREVEVLQANKTYLPVAENHGRCESIAAQNNSHK